MDEMTLLRELRVGLPPASPEARARARALLVARVEQGRPTARARPSRPTARARSGRPTAHAWQGRPTACAWLRRPLRLAGALAVAAALAAVVVALGIFSSGGRVESAAAEALHRTASVAAGSDAPGLPVPAAGQFLYTKTEVVELMAWAPRGHLGRKGENRNFSPHVSNVYPDAPPALVTTVTDKWTAANGTIHERETLGPVKFFSAAAQHRWEAAGSPPPWSFDPRFHQAVRDHAGTLEKSFVTRKWAPDISFPDPSLIPTDPQALRLAVEGGKVGPPWTLALGTMQFGPETTAAERTEFATFETTEKLFEILEKPTATGAIRAAAFNALAELPGIELESGVTDVAGRRGDAIVRDNGEGIRTDYTFDPATARLLARGETVSRPRRMGLDVPAGTPFRQTAFLESGIVDSATETTAAAHAAGSP
jgi:hypothetical protein